MIYYGLSLIISHLSKGMWSCPRCGYDYGQGCGWIKFYRDKYKIQAQSWELLLLQSCQILMSFCLCSHYRKRYLQISNLSPWGLLKFLVTYLCHLSINICSQVKDSSCLNKMGIFRLHLRYNLTYKYNNY